MTDILARLKGNEKARNAIREDILHLGKGKYLLNSRAIDYFLDPPDTTGLTFQHWFEGNFAGSISEIKTASDEDRAKIENAQNAIVRREVKKRYEQLVSHFNKRTVTSIDKEKMIDLELETIDVVLDPNGLDYKPTNNQPNIIGNYSYSTRTLSAIREYHREFILGYLDFSEVPSDNQKINSGQYRSKLIQIVEAIALNHFRTYLMNYKSRSEKLNPKELDGALSKFDEILEEIRLARDEIKQGFSSQVNDLEDLAADQFNRHWETLEGLNLLYDETQDLKSLLPVLPKKTLSERFLKKFIERAGTKLSIESVKWICRKLNIDDKAVDLKNALPEDIMKFLE